MSLKVFLAIFGIHVLILEGPEALRPYEGPGVQQAIFIL